MEKNENWLGKIASATGDASTETEINRLYRDAKMCMIELNKTAAKLCFDFNAHCATDVTGFGLLGHAENLSGAQRQKVQFVIKSLPILKGARQLDQALGAMFQLLAGRSAETSGELLALWINSKWYFFVLYFFIFLSLCELVCLLFYMNSNVILNKTAGYYRHNFPPNTKILINICKQLKTRQQFKI